MLNKYKEKLWVIFLIYIAINPLLDIIFGMSIFFEINLPVNINHIVRVLGIMLMLALVDGKKSYFVVVGYSIWIVLGVIIGKISGLSVSIVTDFSWNFKMLTSVLIILLVYTNYDKQWFSINKIYGALIISALIASSSIFLSITGFGFPTYSEERWGVKGFFYTSNVISIFLLLVYPLVFFIENLKKKIVVSLILCVTLILIGTKTTIFGGIVIMAVLLFLIIKKEGIFDKVMSNPKIKRLFYYAIFIVTIICTMIIIKYIYSLYVEYTSVTYYNSLFDFVLSNRNVQIEVIKNQINNMSSEWKIIGLFFGFGYSRIESEYRKVGNFRAIEMDLHGILYNFGVIVLLIFVLVVLYILYKAIKNVLKKPSYKNVILFLILGTGLFHAVFAGHVFYEALSQIPFWVVCADIVCISKKENNIKLERKVR